MYYYIIVEKSYSGIYWWTETKFYVNIGHKYCTARGRAFIFCMCVPFDKNLSVGTNNFEYDALTVTFYLHLGKRNFAMCSFKRH